MEMIVLFGVLFGTMLIGVPLGFAVGISTIVAFVSFTSTPLMLVVQSCVTGIDSFSFLAIPLFIMSGALMSKGGIAKRLVDMFQVLLGHVPGGLGLVSTATCGFFGAISGSATATCSAIGSLMFPEMKNNGYPPEFNAMCIAAAGSTALLIPPSVCLVLYGVATETSVGDLLLAGVIPGIVVMLCLFFATIYYSRKYHFKTTEKQPISKFFKAMWDAKWALGCPIIILGGIYGGIFTATEAAVVSVIYAIVVGFFVYKDLTWDVVMDSLKETMVLSGMLAYMLGTATAFAKFLQLAQVPAKLVAWITGLTDNSFLLLLFCNVLLLMIGCVVDNIPVILIMSPLLLPIAQSAGMDPVTFGCVMVLNTTIGLITPPYGADLFFCASIAGVSMESTLKYFWMFFLTLIASLFIITYVPWMTTWML